MESFSEKYGFKPKKTIFQLEDMDDDLRNGLWNALHFFYWNKAKPHYKLKSGDNKYIYLLLLSLWDHYFRLPVDTIPEFWQAAYKEVRESYFSYSWNEVYDFIQFIANNYIDDSVNENFKEECNDILKRELSGYRFIGGSITPITAEEEIAEITEALESKTSLRPVKIHLNTALELFSNRTSPDYRNSIKESISAVEAICRLIAGSDATLGKALDVIQEKGKIDLHGALKSAFDKLYGYTSDEDGIRHSMLEEPILDFEDAKFMLVSCSAFVNYLKVKASKIGIDLENK